MADETNMELVRLLTEDLNKHREYVQKLYTRAFIAGGLIVTAVLGAGFWFLSDRVNNELIQYLVTKKVISIVEPLAKEEAARAFPKITEAAIGQAYKAADDAVDEKVKDEIKNSLDVKLLNVTKTSLEDLVDSSIDPIRNSLMPTSIVAAFNSPTCPYGWRVYDPAEEGVIVGKGYLKSNLGARFDLHVSTREYQLPMIEAYENRLDLASKINSLEQVLSALGRMSVRVEDMESQSTFHNEIYRSQSELERLKAKFEESNRLPVVALTYCEKEDRPKKAEQPES